MGGCYSTANHRGLALPKHKIPKDVGTKENGKAPNNAYIFKPTNGLPSEDLHQSPNYGPKGMKTRNAWTDSTAGGLPLAESLITPENVGLLNSELNDQSSKGVVPSDSGIGSIGSPQEEMVNKEPPKQEFTLCRSCRQKLRRISQGPCQQCGNFRIDASDSPVLMVEDTYCTCGPRLLGKQPTCRTHKSKTKLDPANRHSDFEGVALKSSLKKNRLTLVDGRRVCMSWKSTDSLDLSMSLCTCMDQAKSVASEIFGDDVSFRAPLAQFDSVDCRLDDRNSTNRDSLCDRVAGGGAVPIHRLSIYSEVMDLVDSIYKCDHITDAAGVNRHARPVHEKEEEENHLDNSEPSVHRAFSSGEYPHLQTKNTSVSSDNRMDSEILLRRWTDNKRDHISVSVSDADQDAFDETEKLLSEETTESR